jgi:hypothetical protein
MLKVKWHYEKILNVCRFIQRVFRGHLGRKIFYHKNEEEKTSKQLKFFHAMAKIIQK